MENNLDINQIMAEQNKLLRQNLELSQQILDKASWTKTYLKWQQIFSIAKVTLIVIPIIIGLIYLPPMIKNYLEQLASLYK